MSYRLRLTKGQAQNAEGLELLRLALWNGDPRSGATELDHVTTVSGQPGCQYFRRGEDSEPGSMEPIPQGEYTLGEPVWASGDGNWAVSWSDGLGPVVIDVEPLDPAQTRRGDLRIHCDWNEDRAPGSAGCITVQGKSGPRDLARMKQVLSWFAQYHPKRLTVDWHL